MAVAALVVEVREAAETGVAAMEVAVRAAGATVAARAEAVRAVVAMAAARVAGMVVLVGGT